VALIEVRSLVKNYGGLRPPRIRELAVEAGEVVVIGGPDERAAAVLSDLLTGAMLPDEGEVTVAGRSTASLGSPEDWLAFLDRLGLVNPRIVLLDQLTVGQNLAVALTLDVDPMSPDTRSAVAGMAARVGLAPAELDLPLPAASPLARFRLRVGRALAHGPAVLLVEHPTLDLARDDVAQAARLIRDVGAGRERAAIVVSGDPGILGRAATRGLTWRPATGELLAASRWPRWLRL